MLYYFVLIFNTLYIMMFTILVKYYFKMLILEDITIMVHIFGKQNI